MSVVASTSLEPSQYFELELNQPQYFTQRELNDLDLGFIQHIHYLLENYLLATENMKWNLCLIKFNINITVADFTEISKLYLCYSVNN